MAPFHVLASEEAVHADQDHVWHLSLLGGLAEADPALFVATAPRRVDLNNAGSSAEAGGWP